MSLREKCTWYAMQMILYACSNTRMKHKGVYQLLIERLRKFGLEIAEDKSRILPFGRYKGTKESFDFFGFTHYNATSHWGKYCVLHKTSKKKLKMKREAIKKRIWEAYARKHSQYHRSVECNIVGTLQILWNRWKLHRHEKVL